MWLKILYSKLLHWWSQTYHPDASRTHQRYGALTALDPSLYARYRTTTACVYPLRVLYPDLSVYTQKLRYLCAQLESGALIENHWCLYEHRALSLERFFIDTQGMPLSPVQEVTRFKMYAQHFFTLYAGIEHSQAEVEGHNARILSKFETHLLTLIEDLLTYSYRCA